jgi:peroxiredoxin
MSEKIKHGNSWISLILIGVVVAAGAIVTTLKKTSISEYVNESGNIVISQNSPFSKWFGKEAPDFTFTDIEGKTHSLSDYRGKNVMVVFWATWCPPCNAEIPHLMDLRKQESEGNLAILALSGEDSETVRKFAEARKINYTAASLGNSYLPEPFINVEYIPTSFFIDPDGRIKTVVVQSLTLEQMKTILEAKTTVNDSTDS